MRTLTLTVSATTAALAAIWFTSQPDSPALILAGSGSGQIALAEVAIPMIERNGELRPASYISHRESVHLIEEAIGKKAANTTSADLEDARQWARIGWNKKFRSSDYYLNCGGIAAPSDDQLSEMQAILDRQAGVIGPIREEFTGQLIDFSDMMVVELGQYYLPRLAPDGGMLPAPYNGSWQLFQYRPEIGDTILVQIFPGEDAILDHTFDELQAALDSAFWEIGEFVKDCKQ